MTDTYKETNYVLHGFPMTISYNGVNQFTVKGFARVVTSGQNKVEEMIVKNLNILDFVIRFLSFLTKEDTILMKKRVILHLTPKTIHSIKEQKRDLVKKQIKQKK